MHLPTEGTGAGKAAIMKRDKPDPEVHFSLNRIPHIEREETTIMLLSGDKNQVYVHFSYLPKMLIVGVAPHLSHRSTAIAPAC